MTTFVDRRSAPPVEAPAALHPWSQLGAQGRRSARANLVVVRVLGALYVGVVAPTVRSEINGDGSVWVVAAIALGAAAVMTGLPRRWWAARLAVATAAGALVAVSPEGRLMGIWLAASLVLAVWACLDRPPIPVVGRVPVAMIPVAVLAALAAVRLGTTIDVKWQPMAALCGAGVLVLLSAGRSGPGAGRIERAFETVDRFVFVGISSVAYVVVGAASLLRLAVVRRPFAGRPGWVTDSAGEAEPRALGVRTDGATTTRVWLRCVAMLAVVGVVGWAIVAGIESIGSSSPTAVSSAEVLGVPAANAPIPEAYEGEAWYPDFVRDLRWVADERVAWRPMAVQRVLDVETPTINVRDRRRQSWTAPACDCRRVTVWMYGGSGAFGLGQRDEHTIASGLARLAYDDGVVVDVQNLGIPGTLHWRNSTRFAWDLSVDPKPDLVVFYEGAEEVESEIALRQRRLGNTVAPFDPFLTDLYDEVVGVPDVPPVPPVGVEYVGWPVIDESERPPGVLATERYERSRAMSRGTAEASSIPVRYFWQPSRFDRDESRLPENEERRAAFRGAAASVPPDAVNLADALDDVPGPLFSDDTNHNEVAARAIAAAMWAELRDDVRALSE